MCKSRRESSPPPQSRTPRPRFNTRALASLFALRYVQRWRSSLRPPISAPLSLIIAFASATVFALSIDEFSPLGLARAVSMVAEDAMVVSGATEQRVHDGTGSRALL